MGKLSVRLFAYESSEWNELNTRGVVRLSKEVAIEILGEKKLKHAIVLCVQGTWIVGKFGYWRAATCIKNGREISKVIYWL